MKICTKCRLELLETSFNKSRRNKSGLRAECRECQKKESRAAYGPVKENPGTSRYLTMRVNGVKVSVHRHVAEVKIGRKLLPGEVVHHINGKKKDNRPENLQVMSISEHSRMENLGRHPTEEQRKRQSEAQKGINRHPDYRPTEETKAKTSASMKKARSEKFWSTNKKDHVLAEVPHDGAAEPANIFKSTVGLLPSN